MGSRKSSTNTTTQNEYFDQRQVNDAGGGVIGSGTQDNSVNWSQSIADNRSTVDSGNTSWTQTTTQTDSSKRNYENSGNTTWTNTDGGAIAGMRDVALAQATLAERISKISSDNASMAAHAALKAQENALSVTTATNGQALDLAKSSNVAAFKSANDALGFASQGMGTMAKLTEQLVGSAKSAYDNAASQANGNKTLMYAALAVVGVIGAAMVLKKG